MVVNPGHFSWERKGESEWEAKRHGKPLSESRTRPRGRNWYGFRIASHTVPLPLGWEGLLRSSCAHLLAVGWVWGEDNLSL